MQISWSRASEWNRWKSTIVFKCMNSVECNNWYFMVQHMISFKDSTWSIISALCHDDQPTGGSYAAAVTKLFVFVWCVLYRKTHSVMQIEGGGEWQTHAPRNALLSKGIPLLFVSLDCPSQVERKIRPKVSSKNFTCFSSAKREIQIQMKEKNGIPERVHCSP